VGESGQQQQVCLEPLMTVDFEIESMASAGHPGGDRAVVTVRSGTFSGPAASGRVQSGSDWALRRADGTLGVDVRAHLVTDDGVTLLLTYTGIAVVGPDGMKVQAHARFEAPLDSRYASLNDKICLALGTVGRGTVSYRILALA
jgi:hypothetical protein